MREFNAPTNSGGDRELHGTLFEQRSVFDDFHTKVSEGVPPTFNRRKRSSEVSYENEETKVTIYRGAPGQDVRIT